MDRNSKVVIFLALATMLTASATATTIIDSRNWQDVYSSSLYTEATSSGGSEDTHYVKTSSASGVFNIVPQGEVDLMISDSNSYTSNLPLLLNSRDYSVGDRTTFVDANTELIPSGTENYIVVQEDFPAAAVASAPLARQMDAWVVLANSDNAAEAANIVEDAEGEVLMIGSFSQSVRNQIEPLADEEITTPNKFQLSIEIAEKFEEEGGNMENVRLTSGLNLEESFFRNDMPLLLSGTNFVPENVQQFIEDNDVQNAYVVGNQLTNVGEELRDNVDNDDFSVFVKYGQGQGGNLYALNFYPLPNRNPSLDVAYVNFDPSEERVYIRFDNEGGTQLYSVTSFDIEADGEVVASASRDEEIFLGGDSSKVVGYDVNMTLENLGESNIASLTTTYGTNPDSLDTFVTNEGQFDPPYRTNLTVAEVGTDTEVGLGELAYDPDNQNFVVPVENLGEQQTYVNADVRGIEVDGQETSVSSDTVSVEGQSTRNIKIPTEITSEQFEREQEVVVQAQYGEDEENLVGEVERTYTDIRVQSSLPVGEVATNPIVIVLLILLIIVVLIYYINRKYHPERR